MVSLKVCALLFLFFAGANAWRWSDFFDSARQADVVEQPRTECKGLMPQSDPEDWFTKDWLAAPPQTLPQADKPHPHHPRPHRPVPGPPFYHGLAGPRFKTLNRTCEFEVRAYNASTWIETAASGWSWELAYRRGTATLDRYFEGANANKTHIRPTVPVITQFTPRKKFVEADPELTIRRFLPPAPPRFNNTPPAPTSKDVHIKHFPSSKAYVRQFGGLGMHWSVLQETKALARALEHDGVNVTEGHFLVAGYDRPFSLFHRHNEVWFVPQPTNRTTNAALDAYFHFGVVSVVAD